MFTDKEKIDILVKEWELVNKSSEWNFDNYEKYRNYYFILAGVVMGITNTAQNSQLIWLIVPPMLIVFLMRMISQTIMIYVKDKRRFEIEEAIQKVTQSNLYFQLAHMIKKDKTSFRIYMMNYIWLILVFLSILIYSIYKAQASLGINLLSNIYLLINAVAIVWMIIEILLILIKFRKIRQKRSEILF